MAKNIQNVRFLRNGNLFTSRDAALTGLNGVELGVEKDGTIILARYGSDNNVKTLAGLVYFASNDSKSITVIDIEGASAEVEALRQEINAKLGDGVSSANTVTAQLTALSGNGNSTSAETSVEGAKRYADELKNQMDYTGVTTGDGVYITNVTQADGMIAATTGVLPTVATITDSGKPIIAVAEDKGTIAASAGTIDAQYVDVTGFTATNVQGALEEVKANIGEAISGLDVSDEAVAGEYVSQVSENDGKISVTRVALPSSADTAVAKKVVIAVAEDKGQINVSRGEITSSGKTIVLTDNADGGINFEANIDNNTLTKNADGVISVTSSALVQYEGDGKTIEISEVENAVRTVSSLITLSSITPSSTTVKEEYALKNASGETIGSTIKIYKDSSLYSAYLGHVDDTITSATDPTVIPGTGDTALCFIYLKTDGTYELVAINVEEFIEENEFASGVTWDNVAKKVKGVVDPTSESFLTVGADGFKISGVSGLVENAIDALDADLSGSSTHVTVGVVEEDGVITAVTVSEDNIANADDLAELSAKTVTEIGSSNNSVEVSTATTTAADGTVKYNVITDADKIQMSGFSADSASALSGIAESDSIATAFEKTNTVITENERVTAAALTDLNNKIASGVASATTEVVEGVDAGNNMSISSSAASDGHTVYTISLSDVASASALTAEITARKAVDGQNGDTYVANSSSSYISSATSLNDADVKLAAALAALDADVIKGVKVNGSGLSETNNEVNIQITSAPVTGLSASPINVATDSTGAVTLTFEDLDAGTY